jgi:hypothetical protein
MAAIDLVLAQDALDLVEADVSDSVGCGLQKLDLASGVGGFCSYGMIMGSTAFSMIVRLAWDLLQWCGLILRPRESLEAEILFLRRQLALYRERGVKPKRMDAATRVTLTFLSRWFDWRSALVVVRPETLIRWHRAGFQLFWRWKSRSGRPVVRKNWILASGLASFCSYGMILAC